MDRPRKNRRRNLLSYPRVQVRLIAVFALLAVAYGLVNYHIALGTLNRAIRDVRGLPLSDELRHDVGVLAREHTRTLHGQLALFTLLSLAMLGCGGLLLSHRLAGPLHQLSTYLRGMASRSVPPWC